MEERVYRYKPTYGGLRRVPAPVVGAELERLAHEGPLTAKRVVEAAHPPEAPLHDELEWNDAIAATAHREQQARHLIRGVVVEVRSTPNQPRTIEPAFIHVPASTPFQEGAYVPPARLAQAPDEFQRALMEALRRLESAEAAVHYLRRLTEGHGESVGVAVSMAHEGFHVIRTALEMLKAA